MFASLTIVKEFLTHWVGITIVGIVLAISAYAWYEHHENNNLTAQIATLNQTIGADKAQTAQWQGAASDCSSGVAAVAASEAQATSDAVAAVAAASSAAKVYTDHANYVLNRKPGSADDYTASKQLMNDLIDNRQAQLGAK